VEVGAKTAVLGYLLAGRAWYISRLAVSSALMTCWMRRPTAGDTAMQHHHLDSSMPADSFPTDPAGLPEASPPQLLELADGDTLELRVGPVAKPLGDITVRMLG
jgi:hypothetical protein